MGYRDWRLEETPPAWRFWRVTLKAADLAYRLGVIAGYGTGFRDHWRPYVGWVIWRGRRVFVLGRMRR